MGVQDRVALCLRSGDVRFNESELFDVARRFRDDHQITDEDFERLVDHMTLPDLEDGFPDVAPDLVDMEPNVEQE
eukprot:11841279-Karenia_brevis.AAC.1